MYPDLSVGVSLQVPLPLGGDHPRQKRSGSEQGSDAIECILLDISKIKEVKLHAETFNKMDNLRMLHFYKSSEYYWNSDSNVFVGSSLESLPDSLKILHWDNFPQRSLAQNYCPENLVRLEMRHSRPEQLWEGDQCLPKLKRLDLSNSRRFIGITDLCMSPNIEEIVLSNCVRLGEVYSTRFLSKLNCLCLHGCRELETVYIPCNIMSTSSGVILLYHCHQLQSFSVSKSDSDVLPSHLGRARPTRSISPLQLNNIYRSYEPWYDEFGYDISEVMANSDNIDEVYHQLLREGATSIFSTLNNLCWLDLSHCGSLTSLPFDLSRFKFLKRLDLRGCRDFGNFLQIKGRMENLAVLILDQTAIREVPSSLCRLVGLQELSLRRCTSLEIIPPSIGTLTKLSKLDLTYCESLQTFPTTIFKLNLTKLNFHGCSMLSKLPEILEPTKSFADINLTKTAIKELPSSFKNWLGLGSCVSSTAVELSLQMSAIVNIPQSIAHLSSLKSLDISDCKNLRCIPQLPPFLKKLLALDCPSIKRVMPISSIQIPSDATKGVFKFHLTNSQHLDPSARANIVDHARLKITDNAYRSVFFHFPGSAVPHWFPCRAEGHSVTINTDSLNLCNDNRIIGLALCFSFRPVDTNDIFLPYFSYKLKFESAGGIHYLLPDHYQPTDHIFWKGRRRIVDGDHTFLWKYEFETASMSLMPCCLSALLVECESTLKYVLSSHLDNLVLFQSGFRKLGGLVVLQSRLYHMLLSHTVDFCCLSTVGLLYVGFLHVSTVKEEFLLLEVTVGDTKKRPVAGRSTVGSGSHPHWEILAKSSPVGTCSRILLLWTTKPANFITLDVTVEATQGTDKIQCILLDICKIKEVQLHAKTFEKMDNLRMLQFYKSYFVNLNESNVFRSSLESLPDSLKVLHWDDFPRRSLPLNFFPENLVRLVMHQCQLEQWEQDQHLPNLKRLDLSNSWKLTEIPDLCLSPNIEEIILSNCVKVVEVYSTRFLSMLNRLCLDGCVELDTVYMPCNILSTSSGEILLYNCRKLQSFSISKTEVPPPHLGRPRPPPPKATGVYSHVLDNASFKSLPCYDRFEEVENDLNHEASYKFFRIVVSSTFPTVYELCWLDLSNCESLTALQFDLSSLKFLKRLHLRGCYNLGSFPQIKERMENLVQLILDETAIREIPSSLCHLVGLQELSLHRCTSLEIIPPSIGTLTKLSKLGLAYCVSLQTFPTTIFKLKLTELDLHGCSMLSTFPEILEPTKSIVDINLTNTAIQELHHLKILLGFSFCVSNGARISNSTEGIFKFHLTHCQELDPSAHANIVDYACLKITDNAYRSVFFSFPGSAVPHWFPCRAEGHSVATHIFTIIELLGYTPEEKHHLAMQHFIPIVLEQHASSSRYLQIPEALQHDVKPISQYELTFTLAATLIGRLTKSTPMRATISSHGQAKGLKNQLRGNDRVAVKRGTMDLVDPVNNKTRSSFLLYTISLLCSLGRVEEQTCLRNRINSNTTVRPMATEVRPSETPMMMSWPILQNITYRPAYDVAFRFIQDISTGSDAIQCIFLDICKIEEVHLHAKTFNGMSNMRMLYFYKSPGHYWNASNVFLQSYLESLPGGLKILRWDDFPQRYLPQNFSPKCLVRLEMRHCKLEQLWERDQHLPKLKRLDLRVILLYNCPKLRSFSISNSQFPPPHLGHARPPPSISSFVGCRMLFKALNLPWYHKFEEATDYIKTVYDEMLREGVSSVFPTLNKLCWLDLSDCQSLTSLPFDLSEFKCLKRLYLRGCSNLRNFPQIQGKMENLVELILDKTAIRELPSSLCHLVGLEELSLHCCIRLEIIPSSIGRLTKLSKLGLTYCESLQTFPSNIFKLMLTKLNLHGFSMLSTFPEILEPTKSFADINLTKTAIKELPSSFENLVGLRILRLIMCTDLESLPNSIVNLNLLSKLDCSGCAKLTEIPSDIGRLSLLRKLSVQESGIVNLPQSICHLSSLKSLDLSDCENLQCTPPLPPFLKQLLAYDCPSIKRVMSISRTQIASDSIQSVFEFHLTNSQLLVPSARANIVGDARLKITDNACKSVLFYFPGSAVPQWFPCRSKGHSVTINTDSPSLCNDDRIIGFALCFSFGLMDGILRRRYAGFSYKLKFESAHGIHDLPTPPLDPYRLSNSFSEGSKQNC
ncbi:hypothetical protein Fmac_003695 [Flemingia macrophylla]|uniref:C-JID domain-containing protein n=1 Tax=Flemingia macrophylla TaxID=520843 RepID=A0ABD1N5D6_9FABA